jgi:hypothetical protein
MNGCRKEEEMKKFMLVLLGLFILTNCATVPKSPLSSNDLPSLKGIWEGGRDMIWGRYRSTDHTIMEVYNDTVPLKGKVEIAFMEGRDTRVYDFENGTIDPQGNLVVQLREDIRFILSFYKEEKRMKLDGDYYHGSVRGRLTLYKK